MIDFENQAHRAPSAKAQSGKAMQPAARAAILTVGNAGSREANQGLAAPFEKITRLAARLLNVQAAVVGVVHAQPVWHWHQPATLAGFDGDAVRKAVTWLCAHLSAQQGDAPIQSKPDEHIAQTGALRFCAGVALVGKKGDRLGALCVFDQRPRELDRFELATLTDLAAIAADELELRVLASAADDGCMPIAGALHPAHAQYESHYQSLVGLLSDWHWEQDEHCRFTLIAKAGQQRTSDAFTAYLGKTFCEIPSVHIPEKEKRVFDLAIARRQPFQEVIVQWTDADAALHYLSISGQPIFRSDGCFRGYRGVTRDVTEKIRFQEELARSNAALRKLSEAQQEFREAERKRIARELHDELAQLLASSRMELCLLQRELQPASSHEVLDKVDSIIGTSIVSLRKLATDLRPSSLDEGGLYYALRSMLKAFSENTGTQCHLIANEGDLAMDELRSTAIFRLMEECLSNIARHAKARNAVVQIRRSGNALELRVQDDGRGILQEEIQGSNAMGLMEMRERVRSMKGRLEIKGLPGKGTRIAMSFPQFFPAE